MTPETLADLDNWKPERVENTATHHEKVKTMRLHHEGLTSLLENENLYGEHHTRVEKELWAVVKWLREHDNKH